MNNTIICPLSAYKACSEMAQVVSFGSETRSAKRGHQKVYIRCPEHGSIRIDKESGQQVIKAINGIKPEVAPETVSEKPEVKPEKAPEPLQPEPDTKEDEWGF
jgi:hypothetical protein